MRMTRCRVSVYNYISILHFVLNIAFTKILYAVSFVPKLTYIYGVISLLVCVLPLGWLLIFSYFVEVALLFGEFGCFCSFGSGGGFMAGGSLRGCQRFC
jgi:hypothetical protein